MQRLHFGPNADNNWVIISGRVISPSQRVFGSWQMALQWTMARYTHSCSNLSELRPSFLSPPCNLQISRKGRPISDPLGHGMSRRFQKRFATRIVPPQRVSRRRANWISTPVWGEKIRIPGRLVRSPASWWFHRTSTAVRPNARRRGRGRSDRPPCTWAAMPKTPYPSRRRRQRPFA
jgi:hypothetical protein